MKKMTDAWFWILIVAITMIGTAASVLFKYGLDSFGTVTPEHLTQVRIHSLSLAGVALLGVGTIMILLGGHILRSASFAFEILFAPAVLVSFVLALIGRFLMCVPLSASGLGRLNALLTVLSIISTAAASTLLFKELLNTRVAIGFLLGAASILLIGET